MQIVKIMLAQLPNNSYLCKCKDSSGVATLRKGQTDSLSLLSFVGITHNVGSMNKEQEIWKPVVGFEGCVEVSNLGRIRTMERLVTYSDGRVFSYKSRILKPRLNKGYLYINIARGGKGNMFKVHRIVAQAFIPNPENKPCVDHINTIRTDNRVENLRWVTHSENMRNELTRRKASEMMRSWLTDKMLQRKKEIGKSIRKVYQFDLNGSLIAEFSSLSDAARAVGVDLSSISQCCNHKRGYNHAGGYLWSYSGSTAPYVNPMLSHYHSIAMYDLQGNLIRKFKNVIEASEMMGVKKKGIQKCCRGDAKTYLGYIWRYADEDNNNKTK